VRSTNQSGYFESLHRRAEKGRVFGLFDRTVRAETLYLRRYELVFKKVSVGPLRGQQHQRQLSVERPGSSRTLRPGHTTVGPNLGPFQRATLGRLGLLDE
jgi:hypothetical protein